MNNPFTRLQPVEFDVDPRKIHAMPNAARGNPLRVMSRSNLIDFAACPRRWTRSREKEPTKAMILGDLLDCILICPTHYDSRYAVAPETYNATPKATKKEPYPEPESKPWNWNATVCKDWRTAKLAEGFQVVTADDVEEAQQMAGSVMFDKKLAEFMKCSKKQALVHVRYIDKATGIEIVVRCILDLVPDPKHPKFGSCLGDLKTTYDAEPRGYAKAIFNMGYAVQAAMYLDAYNAAAGTNYSQFCHIVVENEHPYEPARRVISQDFIDLGRALYISYLERYCRCLKENFFPGYDDENDNPTYPVIDGWRVLCPEDWMVLAQ